MPDQNFPPPPEDENQSSPPQDQNLPPPWQPERPPSEELEKPVNEPLPGPEPWPKPEPEPELGVEPTEAFPARPKDISVEKEMSFPPPLQEEVTTPSLDEAQKKAETFLSQSEAYSLKEGSSGRGFKKVLLVLLVLGLLFAAGWAVLKFVLPRFQGSKEVTLTYWGLWEPENVMKTVITDWEVQHPNIKINYVQQSPKEYRERLQSALARQEGPDIFRFHLTWGPMLKNELQPMPAEVMTAAEFESSYYPVVKENLRFGPAFLGLPLGIDTLALFYNQQIFQAAGKTPPTSWDQLRQLALELTVLDGSGRIQTAGVALGTTNNVEHWSDILGLMMLQNGVNLAQPTGNLAEDALTFYTIFNKTDRVWDETLPTSIMAFATGKVAMYFGYSWDVFEIKNLNPNLDFRVVPVPQLPGTEINWASFWVEGVSKRSQNSQSAWEFLKFLSSSENLQKLYQAQSQARLFGGLYPRMEMANLLTSNSLIAPFINQMGTAKTWYLCSRTFDNGLNDRMIKYYEDAVNAVNSQTSVEEALKITSQGVSQLLSQYDLGGLR